MRSARGQRQPPARNQIQRTHLAPDIEDDSTQCIAGQRIGSGPQRRLGILRPHRHQKARIEPKLLQSVHGQRAGFPFRKILPHPHQRSSPDQAMGNACDETCGRRAIPAAVREHFMQRPAHQPALQHRVHRGMAEGYARKTVRLALKASDGSPQGRKRACACDGA